MLVLNKTDLATPQQVAALSQLLARLNPGARIVATQQGRVSAAEVLNTGRFDEEVVQSRPGWLQVTLVESAFG